MRTSRGKGGASFPLQLLLLLSVFMCIIWFIITVSLMIFKGVNFPYADYALGLEIAAPFLFVIIHLMAFSVGKRGNLTESLPMLVVAGALVLLCAVAGFYYMWLQTYVLMLDLYISAFYLGVCGLTLLFSIVAMQNAAGGASNATPPQGPK